jgi:Tfp pilus assembly protein PilN
MVLVRTIILPSALDSSTLSSVVAEEVRKSSPFGDTATDWGMIRSASADGERIKVSFALASRAAVTRYLASKSDVLSARQPEVWARSAEGVIPLAGYGEQKRYGRERWLGRGMVLLATLALVELALIAISPYVQTRARLFEANAQYEALLAKASPPLRVREGFQHTVGLLDEANESLRGGRPDIPSLLDELTRIIPDDTFISELRLRQGGRKINLSGETENASRLLQHISADKLFSEVKSTGASSRVRDRETFSLEITVSEAP